MPNLFDKYGLATLPAAAPADLVERIGQVIIELLPSVVIPKRTRDRLAKGILAALPKSAEQGGDVVGDHAGSQQAREAAQSIPHSLSNETALEYEHRVLKMLPEAFTRFEAAIRKDEAEQCARVADALGEKLWGGIAPNEKYVCDALAASLRARHTEEKKDA